MRVWKWLGWDTKEARTERNRDNNKHNTIQWAMACVAIMFMAYACSSQF